MVQLGWREYFPKYGSAFIMLLAQAHEQEKEKLQMEKIKEVKEEQSPLGQRRWDQEADEAPFL